MKWFSPTIYALLLIAFIHFYFFPTDFSFSSKQNISFNNQIIINPSPPQQGNTYSFPINIRNLSVNDGDTTCDYSEGIWVRGKKGPLYNGTSCNTIKDGQNCISHGRSDQDYLYYRWKPEQCKLSRFDPVVFLEILKNKHLAFVGDSMARNQLESLMCMLAIKSKPDLVYKDGEENKFRKWYFPSYNASVSIYWSPFLVKGVEKKGDLKNNLLYLDTVNERWGNDLVQMDIIVLSVGHWFLHPAVYYVGDTVLGCHFCPGQNYTEIGFYDVFRKALNTTLKTILERKGPKKSGTFDVFVTTFSPHHFEGEWDKFGACPKTVPYKVGEKELQGMDAEIRNFEVEEVNLAKVEISKRGYSDNLRLEGLDVTKLSFLRPDGHPGPYMYPNPFANGITERVQNDCVHWCLPGAIDTWNEILLDLLKKWHRKNSKK
ncbi:hypothetical protein Leryth_009934 [Lithospermum erythrorhizon]|nr:hypothetical protein Leryth_009934 [Lithospermum erythrorhizon]